MSRNDFVVRLLAEEAKTDYVAAGCWIDKSPFASSFFPAREFWFDDDRFLQSVDEITSLEEYFKRPYPEECYEIRQYPDFSFGPPYRFGRKAKIRDMESYSSEVRARGISGVISPSNSSVSGGCLLSTIPGNSERMTLSITGIHSLLIKDNAHEALKHSIDQLVEQTDPLAVLLYREDAQPSLKYNTSWGNAVRGKVEGPSRYFLGLITYLSHKAIENMQLSEEQLFSLPGFPAKKLGEGILITREGDFIAESRESFAQAWSTAINVLIGENK